MAAPKKTERNASLKEGIDYYIESGKYVFTGHFLKERGFCCESGCRHCPYGFPGKGKKSNSRPGEKTNS